jgi:hypothetical protein
MRSLLFAVGIVIGIAAAGGDAHAQNYPWCAEYGGGDMGGATNCGFTTYEQCMATLGGMGGFCNRNTQYVAPSGPRPDTMPALRRHHRHYPQS